MKNLIYILILTFLTPILSSFASEEILKIKGNEGKYKIKVKDGVWKLYTPNEGTFSFSMQVDGYGLHNAAGELTHTIVKKDNGLAIMSGDKEVYSSKTEGIKTKFFEAGKKIYRTKLKEKKVNVYNANDEKIGKCKLKETKINIYNKSGERIYKATGKLDLTKFYPLCTPLDKKIALLFWYALNK